jgi:hypothetical protein
VSVLLIVVLLFVVLSVPAYVIGRRSGVRDAWVAFIPFVGSTIVLLWSIDRSGWMCLIGLIPLAGAVFSIWLLFAVPAHHGRTRWWGAAFFVPLIGMYSYAFTLPDVSPTSA